MALSARDIATNAVRIATGTDTFSVANFRQQFAQGVGRPNLFIFELAPPTIFTSQQEKQSKLLNTVGIGLDYAKKASELIGASNPTLNTLMNESQFALDFLSGRKSQDLKFRVTRAQLPQKTIESYNVSYNGPGFRFPREINNDSITIEVMCSGSYWEHWWFTQWQTKIMNYMTPDTFGTYDVEYFDDFSTTAKLKIYNDDGQHAYTVFFNSVWPEVVGGETFDWSRKDAISSFPVVLHYSVAFTKMEDTNLSTTKKLATVAQRFIPNL